MGLKNPDDGTSENSLAPSARARCCLRLPRVRLQTLCGLGADEVVVSKNEAEMLKHANSFDFILDTVSTEHDLNAYINLLKRDGTMTLVGAPPASPTVQVFGLLMKRRQLAGSGIGGIRETQEMLDFSAEHGIVSDIEMIPIQKINEAYQRLLKSDVKCRFVIDMASLK
jgi:alcohol dehydrogenase (NADP+)